MPAPFGNRNAVRHGLVGGSLPKGAAYIKRIVEELRRNVEQEVIAHRGEVTLSDAALINSVLRWERHSLLCQRWLRQQFDALTPTERLNFSRESAKASSERDRCLRLLGLDAKTAGKDPLAYLDPVGTNDNSNPAADD